MKKLLILIAIICLFAFGEERTLSFHLKEGQAQMLYNTLTFCKNAIPTSTVPVNQAVQAMSNIDSLQKLIATQYQLQDNIK